MIDFIIWWSVCCFVLSLLTVRWWLPVMCWRDHALDPFEQGAVFCLLSPIVIPWLLLVVAVLVASLWSRKMTVLAVDYQARKDERNRMPELRPETQADQDFEP